MYQKIERETLYKEKTKSKRDYVIEACLFLMVLSIWILRIVKIEESDQIAIVLNFICLGAISIACQWKKMKIADVKDKTKVAILILALAMIGMGVYLQMLGYIAEGATLILMLIFYAVMWNDKLDYVYWMEKITMAMYYNFIVVLALSAFIAPWSTLTYRGIFYNQNSFAVFLIACLMIFIYNAFLDANRRKWRYLISSGLAICFIILTESRGAQIVAVSTIFVWMVYCALNMKSKKEETRKMLIVIAKIVTIGIVAIPIVIGSLKYVSGGIVQLEEKFLGDSFVVYKYQPDKDRYISGIENNEEDQELEFRLAAENADFSTGRTELWKLYGEEMGLVGHKTAIEYENQQRSAHNTYIQTSYSMGIIAGILILILNILLGYRSLRMFIKKRNMLSGFILSLVIGYGIYTLIETLYFPFYQHISLMLWMIAIPILIKEKENENICSGEGLSK